MSEVQRPVRTRFAPSPTGLLHVGNVRRVLDNWLFTRKNNGEFLLRMDDTDAVRSTKEFEHAIQADLQWLGLTWDLFARQSDRLQNYQDAFDKLKNMGRLYPCYETPEELEFKRKHLLARGLPPRYDRAALNLSDAQKQAFEKEGRKPHWRFLLNSGTVSWDDLGHGVLSFDADKLSDPVLFRSDGVPVYTIASVVDDIDFAITHILRGDDHITNTAIQIQLIEALGADPTKICFGHFPLLTGAEGEGLSKRTGSLSIQSLREEGIEAMAINSLLARLGTSDSIEPMQDLNALTNTFDLSKISRATPKFNVADLRTLNAKLLHGLPYEVVAPRLSQMGCAINAQAWSFVRGNINTLNDVPQWSHVISGDIVPVSFSDEDRTFLQSALAALPTTPWDENTWAEWTNTLKEQTGRKGKALYMPLRMALTAHEHGPEMKHLLSVMQPQRVQERLRQGSQA